jgi:UDP-2-acetamido-2,6-beta-L-arabino-hexul-4-ose reductase
MRVLITGSEGFIGKNLIAQLRERSDVKTLCFSRKSTESDLFNLVAQSDFIFHLAGVNRTTAIEEFIEGNLNLTSRVCDAVRKTRRVIPVVYSSSTQALLDNPYGRSKKAAEDCVIRLKGEQGGASYIFRLPNVFGKWCKPNYNSVVATFSYNISRGMPIVVRDSSAVLKMVYIDDVVERFIEIMDGAESIVDNSGFEIIKNTYETTVGEIAEILLAFKRSRQNLFTEKVGAGVTRALYSTYLSFLPVGDVRYKVNQHIDQRGSFVEMVKTIDCGQFSFFTAHPGVTRGGHYHHSKTEKFLVVKGTARFRFKHLLDDEYFDLETNGRTPEIIETIPGWIHDITNIGNDELVVLLWANEVFNQNKPDTFNKEI